MGFPAGQLGLASRLVQRLRQLSAGALQYWRISQTLTLNPEGKPKGRVLISFLGPYHYRLPSDHPEARGHVRVSQCRQIVRTYLELGYTVDLIDWRNDAFLPRHSYRLFSDVRWNMQRLAPLLNEGCVKLFHADVAHLVFHNWAEYERLYQLWKRRGIVLPPRRVEPPNQAIEHADCALVIGNRFTLGTYRYAGKPLYRDWIYSLYTFSPPEDKDFERARRHFVWFGSDGFVHKGLDLVLEAFARMPDLHLTVCGPLEREPEFVAAFRKELYETPNIETLGWVDPGGQRFGEVVKRSVAIVYPSASEGQSGAVVTCMHAGLIPIVSYETGVDVGDFGYVLPDCSIESIREGVQRLAAMPAEELRERAMATWRHARAFHTSEAFARRYRQIAQWLLEHGPSGPLAEPAPELAPQVVSPTGSGPNPQFL